MSPARLPTMRPETRGATWGGRLGRMGAAIAFAALLGAVAGCGASSPPPELRSAREALAAAQASPSASQALPELSEAQAALDRAEALLEAGDETAASDAAYVARRLAERARVAAIYRADVKALAAARIRAERARRLLVRQADEQAEIERALAEEVAERPRAREVLRAALASALESLGAADALEEQDARTIRVVLHPSALFWPAQAALRPDGRAAMRQIGAAVRAGPPGRIQLVVKNYHGGHHLPPGRLARLRAAVLRDVLAEEGPRLGRIEVQAGAAKTPAESGVELRIVEDELRVASGPSKVEPGGGPELGGLSGDRLPPAHSF